MTKEMNNSTKIDPVTYYEDYEDDDRASSEELKAAFDHLYTAPEEILKLISENVDDCEDELPNDFNDSFAFNDTETVTTESTSKGGC